MSSQARRGAERRFLATDAVRLFSCISVHVQAALLSFIGRAGPLYITVGPAGVAGVFLELNYLSNRIKCGSAKSAHDRMIPAWLP